METAQTYIDQHLAKQGKHDTTVHEKVAPAVTHETVTPHRHHKHYTAVDKEVHQTHYHTSIQPINHREVLNEQHHHELLPVETRKHKHGKDHEVAARLREEHSKWKDQSVTADVTESHETVPVFTGEHIHHHVKEIIQPVIHKTTVQPHVIHRITKIHEHHENAARFHETSSLPPLSLDEFRKQGGVLTGREARVDGFDGEPRSVGGKVPIGAHPTTGNKHEHRISQSSDPNAFFGKTTPPGTAKTTDKPELTQKLSGQGLATTKKPGLTQKLDPRVDADGDGKAGFMS